MIVLNKPIEHGFVQTRSVKVQGLCRICHKVSRIANIKECVDGGPRLSTEKSGYVTQSQGVA